jgi:hypothetical protein
MGQETLNLCREKFDVNKGNKEMMEHLRIKSLKGDLKYFLSLGKI